MRSILIALAFFTFFQLAGEKTIAQKKDSSELFTGVPDKDPQFPGGQAAWIKFIEKYVHPEVASQKNAPAGKYTSIISFLIDSLGNTSDFVVEKDAGFGTAEEALRVLKRGPKWIPAVVNGRPVPIRKSQSITFMVSK